MQINIENSKDLALLQIQLKFAIQNIDLALLAARNNKPDDYENRLDKGLMFIASAIETIYSKQAVAALVAASYQKPATAINLKAITNASLPPEPFDKLGHLRPTMNFRRKKAIVPPHYLNSAFKIGKL